MPKTQLSLSAIPGKRYSFVAKPEIVISALFNFTAQNKDFNFDADKIDFNFTAQNKDFNFDADEGP